MPDKNIFPEQDELDKLSRETFIVDILLIIVALIVSIVGFLIMVDLTVILLRYMGVLS